MSASTDKTDTGGNGGAARNGPATDAAAAGAASSGSVLGGTRKILRRSTSARRSCHGQLRPGVPVQAPPKVRLSSAACNASDTATATVKRRCSSRAAVGASSRAGASASASAGPWPSRPDARSEVPSGFKHPPPDAAAARIHRRKSRCRACGHCATPAGYGAGFTARSPCGYTRAHCSGVHGPAKARR